MLDEALNLLSELLTIKKTDPSIFYSLGFIHSIKKEHQKALEFYDETLRFDPINQSALINKGATLNELKRYNDAVIYLDKALKLNPNLADAWSNKGTSLDETGHHELALKHYDIAIDINPHFIGAYLNRGGTLLKLRRHDLALENYLNALKIQPNSPDIYYGIGNVYLELRKVTEAIKSYAQAIRIDPNHAEANWNKGIALLLSGMLEEGWKGYEWRWKTINQKAFVRRFSKPLWTGTESLKNKTILLYSEQGFGDTIQFSRYVNLVHKLGASVILEVEKPLVELLTNLEGVSQVIMKGSELPPFDYQCPLLSLPLAFNTTLDTIPASNAYIPVNKEKIDIWKGILGKSKKPKVGVVWSGGFRANQPELMSTNDRRNISLNIFCKLQNKNVEFYSLQKGEPAESEIRGRERELWPDHNFHNYSKELFNFSDTAALIANLDLVICVDTATAHLAAAIGKPVWLLSRFDGCWRWLLDRDDSPWYPTVRLYRQDTPYDWDSVIGRIGRDLEEFCDRHEDLS